MRPALVALSRRWRCLVLWTDDSIGPVSVGEVTFPNHDASAAAESLSRRIAENGDIEPEAVTAKVVDGERAAIRVRLGGESAADLLLGARRLARLVWKLPGYRDARLSFDLGDQTFEAVGAPAGHDIAVTLRGEEMTFLDPQASALHLHEPKRTTVWSGIGNAMVFSGRLENVGPEPTPGLTLEVREYTGYRAVGEPKKIHRQSIDPIRPGGSNEYKLTFSTGMGVGTETRGPLFVVDGTELPVFNVYAETHHTDFLQVLMDLRDSDGVKVTHGRWRYVVQGPDAMMTLPKSERETKLRAIADRLKDHHRTFHQRGFLTSFEVRFRPMTGKGWVFKGNVFLEED